MIPDLRCVYCGGLILDRRGTEDDLAVRYIVRADSARDWDAKNPHAGDIRIAWHWHCACEDPLHEAMADSDAAFFRAPKGERKPVIERQVGIVKAIIARISERFDPLIARRVVESMGSRRW